MIGVINTVEQAFIAPRYLAGIGDPGWITQPLHRVAGWSYGHDPLIPRVMLTSPDQLTQLRLAPGDPDDPDWWTIRQARTADHPAWAVTFQSRTPVEIIAAFTDALTDPSGPPAAEPDPFAALQDAGWETPRHFGGLAAPDGITRVERLGTPGSDLWHIETAVIRDPTIWRAVFTGTTPLHLIAAVTQSLADPAPMMRDPRRIPGWARDRMTVHTRPVPTADVAFALERRISSLAERHRHATDVPPAPPGPARGRAR
ncbi:DUF317 domain-containing protein [Streptomyces sp. TRM66268-LWL]|uniref:DUF317 domain-containing protein n=1 Tax=Streptomyces polyasparticus TaxID=2767826 RepID=A0ABR7SJP2_9ACTN|nr:DUF317 domain-containing protein [Streptomyces polyasparticus]MBC9715716.1 DUF317 domain-containing protein [Streptomyces polyasparticus]